MSEKVLDIHERPKTGRLITLSFQHMFAMVGATILVPQLVGLSPAIALLTSGIATIVFILITQFKVPAYLGSSFAFILPIKIATETGGIGSAMIGAMFVSVVYALVCLLIWKTGHALIMRILPPIVVAPVIIVIGLALSPVAIMNASTILISEDVREYSLLHFSAAIVSLVIAIVCIMFFKGIISLMPILIGMIGGYIYSIFIGIVDFTPVKEAAFFSIPQMLIPGVH